MGVKAVRVFRFSVSYTYRSLCLPACLPCHETSPAPARPARSVQARYGRQAVVHGPTCPNPRRDNEGGGWERRAQVWERCLFCFAFPSPLGHVWCVYQPALTQQQGNKRDLKRKKETFRRRTNLWRKSEEGRGVGVGCCVLLMGPWYFFLFSLILGGNGEWEVMMNEERETRNLKVFGLGNGSFFSPHPSFEFLSLFCFSFWGLHPPRPRCFDVPTCKRTYIHSTTTASISCDALV